MDALMSWLGELRYETALEIGGVFFAALSGGLAAVRKNFDLFGVLVIAWAAGLGGGLLRDILIGATPPVGISNWRFVLTAVIAGFAIFMLHPSVTRMRRTVIVLDAWALGFFVLIGTTKGLQFGAGPLASLMVGVLTGIGGGILRDILVGEVPLVLADRQLYAIPAFLGAAVVVGLWHLEWWNVWLQVSVVLMVSGIRLMSLRMGWVVPTAGAVLTGRWGSRHRPEHHPER